MRKIIFLLLHIPTISFAQRQTTYAKLINASGIQLKGDAVTRGFEKWITALSVSYTHLMAVVLLLQFLTMDNMWCLKLMPPILHPATRTVITGMFSSGISKPGN